MSKVLEEYVFESMDQFYDWLCTTSLFQHHEHLGEFHRVYTSISKGCSCGRKKKVQKALALYTTVHEKIDPDTRLDMRRSAQAKCLIFKHEGKVVGRSCVNPVTLPVTR